MKITGKDPATYYLPFATFLGAGALIATAAHGGISGWHRATSCDDGIVKLPC